MAILKLKKYSGRRGEGTFRPMSILQAKALHYGARVWFLTVQGDARECKINGEPKTWKTRPFDIEVPIKYGMYEYARFDSRDIAAGRLLVEVTDDNV